MKQLPNLFTLLNLFFGCVAVICILQNGVTILHTADGTQYLDLPQKIWLAPLFMLLAAVADFVDGFAARLVKASSDLGRELDSLADVISFGVAPGMIFYQFLRLDYIGEPAGIDTPFWVLAPALILPCAAAYRLAVFNLDQTQSYYFKGTPVPSVGLFVASFPMLYWTDAANPVVQFLLNKWVIYVLILALSAGMLSRIPLLALKFGPATQKQQLPRIMLLGIGLISLFFLHWLAVPVIFLFYIVLSLAFKKRIV